MPPDRLEHTNAWMVGAETVGPVNRLLAVRRAIFADLIGTIALVALPALTASLWAVAASLWAVAAGAFLGGMGGMLWSVNARTLSQRRVPDEMLGRHGAAARLFNFGAMPLGAALLGLLAELGGMRAAFGLFAAATAVTPALLFKSVPRTAVGPASDLAPAPCGRVRAARSGEEARFPGPRAPLRQMGQAWRHARVFPRWGVGRGRGCERYGPPVTHS